MKNNLYLLVFTLFIVGSCNNFGNDEEKKALATVFDKSIYVEDLDDLIPEDTSPEDSLVLVKNKIDLWVKKQLMLHKAEMNLSEEQKDIEKKVEDYRASLLIYKYKQEFIKQKLDTVVTDSDVEEYLNMNTENFKLNKTAVKAVFILLPKSFDNFSVFKKLFYSSEEADYDKLIELSKVNAEKYDNFNDKWIVFSDISNMLPSPITKPENFLKTTNTVHLQDKNYHYLVKINDYIMKGNVKPIQFVEDQIRSILLNKRKIALIKELEQNIYNNAIEHNNIKININ